MALTGNVVVEVKKGESTIRKGAHDPKKGVRAVVHQEGKAAQGTANAGNDFWAGASKGGDKEGPVRVGNCVNRGSSQEVIISMLHADEAPPGFLEENDI
jgi:hypothetical protein